MLNPPVEKVNVLGIPVSNAEFVTETRLNAISAEGSLLVTFVNPLACWLQERHPEYVGMLNRFDWVLCDGIGMVRAGQRLIGARITRRAFDLTSIAGEVLGWFARNDLPVVLVGGKPGVAQEAGRILTGLINGLHISRSFSGYGSDVQQARAYLSANPHTAAVCGMGAPLQEQFLLDLRESGWNGIGFTCGGFMDQLIDKVDYYPGWVDRFNFRFAYRLMKEPKRLWRRYLVEYQVFIRRYMGARWRRNG